MRFPSIELVALVFFVGLALPGQSAAASPPDLQSLAWMAGTWTGTQGGIEMEEVWIAPKAGSMLAVHRDVSGGKTVSFEFLRIEATPGGVTYWASPPGKPTTPFQQVENAGRRVVFENPDLPFPRRILYWLGDDGALHAKIEGTIAGKPASEEWAWRRAKPSP